MNLAKSKMNPGITPKRASLVQLPRLELLALAALVLALAGCRSHPVGPEVDSSAPPLLTDSPGTPNDIANDQAAAAAFAKSYYPGSENYSTNDLREGDVIRISFQYSTNFDTVEKVALDGTLNLNMVG